MIYSLPASLCSKNRYDRLPRPISRGSARRKTGGGSLRAQQTLRNASISQSCWPPRILRFFGPSRRPSVRNLCPLQVFFGQAAYDSPFERAAALIVNIAQGHHFGDGNKRTALHLGLFYLSMLGINAGRQLRQWSDPTAAP
ncbi:Fic family protein [Corynebacterium propinquum]|uniref:Fic family protein n=1 Tax=Corynebacterium propinquum TaxID=43769 RepID=UPI0011A019CC